MDEFIEPEQTMPQVDIPNDMPKMEEQKNTQLQEIKNAPKSLMKEKPTSKELILKRNNEADAELEHLVAR
jgi:hypothetical protein